MQFVAVLEVGNCKQSIVEVNVTFGAEQWKQLGRLGYIGDEILAIYVGIIVNHYLDPY